MSQYVTHELDARRMTVFVVSADGNVNDLNAHGEPCRSLGELRAFVHELHEQGAFDSETRDELLSEIPEDRPPVYSTVKELYEYWTAEPHEWGMLGHCTWQEDEPIRFVWREDWCSWQMERWAGDRGVWYHASDQEYKDEDLPESAT